MISYISMEKRRSFFSVDISLARMSLQRAIELNKNYKDAKELLKELSS